MSTPDDGDPRADKKGRAIGDRSIVRSHVWIVVGVTLLTTAVAGAVGLSRPVEHVAESRVEVLQTPTRGAPIVPDMGTEREVATSGEVAQQAAARMSVDPEYAARGLSVAVVTDSHVIVLRFSASDDKDAVEGAEAFTRSYVATRNADQKTRVVSTITEAHLLPGSGGQPLALVLGVGLLVGLALGLACAWLRDRASDLVRSTGELERAGPGLLASGLEVTGAAGPSYGFLSGQLMAMTDHRSDHVRVLVTGLRTSGAPRAVAVRLASTLTGHGRSVELLDSSGRRRALGNGLVAGPGSVEVLTSPRLLDDPETWVLARRADVVLLVVRIGKVRRSDVELAVRGLTAVPGPVVGWVTVRSGEPSDELPAPTLVSPPFTTRLPRQGEGVADESSSQATAPGDAGPP